MVKVLHASDLHGYLNMIVEANKLVEQADMLLFTGDMLPNQTRGNVTHEIAFQTMWWGLMGSTVSDLRRMVGDKPVVVVNGNHDFVDLAFLLRKSGFPNVVSITPNKLVEVCGLTFAGFSNINFIAGEWMFETHYPEMAEVVDKTLALMPDVLVTHAPPLGILDDDNYGVRPLSMTVKYEPEKVTFRYHFFGHCHDNGGKNEEVNGITFYNGATTVRLHEIT